MAVTDHINTTVLLSLLTVACVGKQAEGVLPLPTMNEPMEIAEKGPIDTAVFGAGCFWCVEAVFQELKGVQSVTSGFMGGHVKNPSYKEVVTGSTGHAEVARIAFDPTVITFDELLEVFWKTHDPTTLDRQGADVGTQYRSAVFCNSQDQLSKAKAYKEALDRSGAFDAPIVTEIAPTSEFYPAEDYHQNYFAENPEQGYCRMVIAPKMDKFRKVFKDKLR